MSRHGQAALEYLMTYGWALLALLVAIGALAYATDGFGAWTPDLCTTDPPFACVDAKVQEDGAVLLGIRAGAEAISSVTVTLTCDSDPPQEVTYASAERIEPSTKLNGTLVRLACPPVNGRFDGDIAIRYRYADETVTHEARGEIHARPEP